MRRSITHIALASLLALVASYTLAQRSFQTGTPVVVVTPHGLNVRSSAGLAGARISTVPFGTRGHISDDAPYWADGFWWWQTEFYNAEFDRGWVAEGSDNEVLLDDWSRREVVESFAPLEHTGEWSNVHFLAGLELGLTMRCLDPGFQYHAETFMGAPFPASTCANPHSYHRFDDRTSWEDEPPGVSLLGSFNLGEQRVYLVSYLPYLYRGSGHYGLLNLYLQRPGGIPQFMYAILAQGEELDVATRELSLWIRLHLPGDSTNWPSFHIRQVFAISDEGLTLASRETILNEEGGLAQRMRDETQRADSPDSFASAPVVNEIMSEVSAVALNRNLTPAQRDAELHLLQDRWDAQLLATAVRITPVYDPATGSWRSVDSVAREMTGDIGHESAFARDPVGATVSMFFDPSPSNVSNLLNIPTPFGW